MHSAPKRTFLTRLSVIQSLRRLFVLRDHEDTLYYDAYKLTSQRYPDARKPASGSVSPSLVKFGNAAFSPSMYGWLSKARYILFHHGVVLNCRCAKILLPKCSFANTTTLIHGGLTREIPHGPSILL